MSKLDTKARERLLALVATLLRHATGGAFERRGRDKEKGVMRFAVSFEVPVETLKDLKANGVYPGDLFRRDRNEAIPPDVQGAQALSQAVGDGDEPGDVEKLAGVVLDRKEGEPVPRVADLAGSPKWKAIAEGVLAIDLDEFSV